MKRFLLWAVIFNIVLIPIAIMKTVVMPLSMPSAKAAAMVPAIDLGGETMNFLEQLEADGLKPVIVREVTRKPFTASGATIAMNNDSFQIFEYSNSNIAYKDLSEFADKYANSLEPLVWKRGLHVYMSGDLVILYSGNQEAIINSLNQNAKISLVGLIKPLATIN